ncbi:MAG: hypothetical protein ACOVQ7_00760 [Limnoraphis robusta]
MGNDHPTFFDFSSRVRSQETRFLNPKYMISTDRDRQKPGF